MSLTSCVLKRELVGAPRRPRFHRQRMALVSIGGLIVAAGVRLADIESAAAGLMIFAPLSLAALAGVSLMALGSAAYMVWREREDRTLELAALTDASFREIVQGKLAAAGVLSAAHILSALPLLMLGISLGGVSAANILTALVVLLSTVFLAICIGLYCGATARTERGILLQAGTILVLYLFLLPITGGILALVATVVMGHDFWLVMSSALSPVAVMMQMFLGASNPAQITLLAGIQAMVNIGIGLPFLRQAWIGLRDDELAIEPREPPSDRPATAAEARGTGMEGTRPAGPSRLFMRHLPHNPVAARDLHIRFGGILPSLRTLLVGYALGTPLILLFAYLSADADQSSILTIFLGLARGFSAALFIAGAAILLCGSVSRFGMAFHRGEIHGGAMELLLLTNLTPREIVAGKLQAVIGSILPWLLAQLIFGAATIALDSCLGGRDWVFLTVGVLTLFSLWLGSSGLALWFSLRFGRGMALGGSLFFLLAWLLLGRFLLRFILSHYDLLSSPYESDLPILPIMDIGVPLMVGTGCMLATFARFRSLSLQGTRPD